MALVRLNDGSQDILVNAAQVRVILPHGAEHTLLRFDENHSQSVKMPFEKVASLLDTALRR